MASDSRTVTVNAPRDDVLAFLSDIDNQKTWFPGNLASDVLEYDDQGRCVKARLVNDVKVFKDEFVLNYTHDDRGFAWSLDQPTKAQKSQSGRWTLADGGATTTVTMELDLGFSIPLPGFIQRKTVGDTLKGGTDALVKKFA